ncbi:MAG: MFS transporter [Chloroflexota bacterium]|nr:MFS transporter [Chloroflexota bacterium]MDE2884452.1 MFS transporter [Chloroflexota bacterium]
MPFYGWWIVLSSVLFHGLSGAAFGFTFGQYLLSIEEHFGWSKFAISTTYSGSLLVAGVLSPLHGWLLDRFSPRSIMQAGTVCFGLGFIALPFADTFIAFLAVIMVMSLGANLSGWLTLTTVTTRWFRRKRALALGLSSTGIGLAGVLSTIVAWSLVLHGWESTAIGSGIAVIVIGLPLCQLMRGYPEQHGMLPDGAPPPARSAAGASPLADSGEINFTVREALRDRAFWYVSLGHGVALLAVFAVLVHLVPHLVEGLGWSKTSAQTMLTLVTVTSIVGQVGGGYIGDRYNKARLAAFCMLMHAVALVTLAYASSVPVIVFAALLHGLAWGTRGPLMMAIRADFYGRRYFGQIAGYSNVLVMFGPLIGPSFAGWMSDTYGDYTGAFLAVGVVVGAGSLLFLGSRRPPVPARLRASGA